MLTKDMFTPTIKLKKHNNLNINKNVLVVVTTALKEI